MNKSDNIRILHELIAALDRRMPQMQHAGEAGIARDAAALKASALERVAELERTEVRVSSPTAGPAIDPDPRQHVSRADDNRVT
jgi:hypothetical protein